MASIATILKAATGKNLTIIECVDILKASEGVKANALWTADGHALQHSAAVPGATGFRPLQADYHFRGPVPVEKEVLQGGPNIGKAKLQIKIEADGSYTPKGNTFHSQFVDDDQAAMCLKLLLESGGGLFALKLLDSHPRVSVTVTFGMPGGTKFFSRSAHLMAVGKPTSNIATVDQMNSNDNFVMVDRKDMGSVVATLRSKDSPIGHLHVQTLYPSDTAMKMGASSADVEAKSTADYSGPASMQFM
jgi:hypothetical protein